MSDLPTLMTEYKPGMSIETIVSYQDEDLDDIVTGIRVSLKPKEETDEMLYGQTIGVEPSDISFETFKYDKSNQPDKISILTDDVKGQICDVILYSDRTANHLSKTDVCQPDMANISQTTLRLPKETPLVGFHAKVDVFGLV